MLQPRHQLFVVLERAHALLKSNDLRAGSNHIARHFGTSAVGQSESTGVVGHDANFSFGHSRRRRTEQVDRRVSANAARSDEQSEERNPHAARSKNETKHTHRQHTAEQQGEKQRISGRCSEMSGIDVRCQRAQPKSDDRKPRRTGEKRGNKTCPRSAFRGSKVVEKTTQEGHKYQERRVLLNKSFFSSSVREA